MGEYKYLFGPVPSRRLGRSLGVDLTPYKTCTQDCVFCQLGRTPKTTLTRHEYVPMVEVLDELGKWLKMGGRADHITLSGSGEPTLHSSFGEVLGFVRENSPIKAVLLTNGSLFYLPEVRRQALQAHIVKVSLSAWDQSSYGWVNRPHPDLDFKRLMDGQKAFRNEFKGEIWIEVFLVWGMNSIPSDVAKIATLAELLKPDRIHLNTAVRPPAEAFVEPLSEKRLAALCDLFSPRAEIIADYRTKGEVEISANEESIVSLLRRRPCTAEDIAGAFGMHLNEVSKYLGILMRQGRIHTERLNGSFYYNAIIQEEKDPVLVDELYGG
ncbi:MAG: radical SAM protein [Deltaproteobacteria bacterium]|nr:radical SAM protein [Deltaproteobacteria bacterium]